ncbi:MAG: hypothetical protein IJ496_09445 [Ruminococcus sp.]|nr:hypothetical protein [Ruminococcus sp.]
MKVKVVRKRRPAPVATEQVSGGENIRRAMENVKEKKDAVCAVGRRRTTPPIVENLPNVTLLWLLRNTIEMMFQKIIHDNTSGVSLEDRLALAESLCSREEAETAGAPLTQGAYFEATMGIKSLIFSIREQL